MDIKNVDYVKEITLDSRYEVIKIVVVGVAYSQESVPQSNQFWEEAV